ncbi:hypothetical protein [Nonomuraea sp. NPDC001699]
MSEAAKTYTLLGADGRPYQSEVKGLWGGHCRSKIYGRLDCLAALRAIARGGYVRYRVFFADEVTAIAAGFRPCGACCRDRFQEWKSTRRTMNSSVLMTPADDDADPTATAVGDPRTLALVGPARLYGLAGASADGAAWWVGERR